MNRFCGILMIYVTRPMCWLFALIIVAASVFVLSSHSYKYESFGKGSLTAGIFSSQKRVYSLETLTDAVKASDQRPVVVDYGLLAYDLGLGFPETDGMGARGREILDPDEAITRLDQIQFPARTYSLTMKNSWNVEQSTIEQIGKVSSLKHLKFGSTDSNLPMDLSPLVELKNLNSLDFGNFTKVASLAPLMQLPKLETLTIGNHQLVTTQTMRQVAGIKSLRRLFLPDVTHSPAAMAALEELNQSSLDQVFFPIPIIETASYQAIANSLPDVAVRPSVYSPMRLGVCLGVIWVAMFSSFLGTHFSAMMTLPAAELTPGYKAAQHRTAWAIVFGLVFVGAGLMWSYRVHSGLAITLMSSVLVAIMSSGAGLQEMTKIASKTKRLFGLLLVVFLFAVVGFAIQRPLEIDYLLVHPPLWGIIVLLLTTVYFAVKLNRQLGSACRSRIAVGNDPVLSFSDMQQVGAKLRSQRLGEQVEPYERGVSGMVGIGWALLMVVLFFSYAPPFGFSHIVNKALVTQLPIVAMVALMFVGIKWWRRMPFQATMATRPPNRKTQVNQIFAGVATDFARNTPLLVAVALMVGKEFAEKFGGSIELAMTALLFAFGTVAMIYAFTLWVITVRSTRGVIAVCLLTVLLPAIGGAASLVVLKSDSLRSVDGLTVGFGLASVAMIAIAIVATMLIQRFYQKLEWGSYLP